jgi:hypothetical protein
MAYQDGQGGNSSSFQGGGRSFGPRQNFDVTSLALVCANETCGVSITELPFQPTQKEDGTYGKIYCRECNRERMKARGPRNFGSSRPRSNFNDRG